jgi:hypothetical protein
MGLTPLNPPVLTPIEPGAERLKTRYSPSNSNNAFTGTFQYTCDLFQCLELWYKKSRSMLLMDSTVNNRVPEVQLR